jgi:hypothetical protein
MVTLYTWVPHDSDVGHSSMLVSGGDPAGSIYISWWPDHGGKLASLISCPAKVDHVVPKSVENDVVLEDGEKPFFRTEINGLNETKIKEFWANWQKNPTFGILHRNCAVTTRKGLDAGTPRGVLAAAYAAEAATTGTPTTTTPLTTYMYTHKLRNILAGRAAVGRIMRYLP